MNSNQKLFQSFSLLVSALVLLVANSFKAIFRHIQGNTLTVRVELVQITEGNNEFLIGLYRYLTDKRHDPMAEEFRPRHINQPSSLTQH